MNKSKLRLGLISILTLVTLAACKSHGPVAPQYEAEDLAEPPKGYTPAESELIPLTGENCCARFINQNKQILFLSRQRSRHSHWQVYIYDLQQKIDRRVTYHDGDDQGPIIEASGQWLFYASVTDINKEDPRFLRESLGEKIPDPLQIGLRPLWSGAPFELYRSRSDGAQVNRLTRHLGFDGEIEVDSRGENIYFSSTNLNKTVISKLHLPTMRMIPLTSPEEAFDGEPNLSPDGKQLLWARYAKQTPTAEIWHGTAQGYKPTKLIGTGQLNRSPRWLDNERILFSTNSFAEKNHEIAVYDLAKKCLQRVTYAVGQDLLPAVSSDGKELIVSSDRSGQWQLYISKLSLPTCP